MLCNDQSIYTGVTENLERRFYEHSHQKGGRHTKLNPAIQLLYSEIFTTKQEAFKRERQIKGWRREKKLNLIKFGKSVI